MASGFQPGSPRQSGMSHQPAWLLAVVVLAASAMGARLAWLQLAQGPENRLRADQNRIRLVPRHPVRGRLLDRHGEVLATSRLTYNLYLQPRLVPKERWPALREKLATLLALPVHQLEQNYKEGLQGDGYRIELASSLSSVQVLRFREQAVNLDGAEVDVDYLRSYPGGPLAAHVLGYTSGITEEEYARLADKGYRVQDRIGRTGLEQVYESHLRGEWGGQQLEVNAAGPGAAGAGGQAGPRRQGPAPDPGSGVAAHR